MEELIQYYNEELRYLRNTGDVFAKNNPEIASQLRMDQSENVDPFVEKLVESFAFLTARIKQKLDDGYAEINDALLDIIMPHLTKPIPSVSTVKVQPKKNSHAIHILPKDTLIACVLEDKTTYQFSTVYEAELLPLKINAAIFENAPFHRDDDRQKSAKSKLTVCLETNSKEIKLAELKPKKIRFHMNLQIDQAYQLYELIFNNVINVSAQSSTHEGMEEITACTMKPVGFELDEGALAYSKNSFKGYRLLTEFFSFPQKFLYFDVYLNENHVDTLENKLTITIYFNKKSTILNKVITTTSLELNSVPIINLYQKKSNVINLDHTHFEYSVIPGNATKESAEEVYSIHDVIMVSGKEKLHLYPFFGLKHMSKDDKNSLYWHIRRRTSCEKLDTSVINNNMQISFTDLHSQPKTFDKHLVQAEICCINTGLYEKIYRDHQDFQFNTLSEKYNFVESVKALSNITDVKRVTLGHSDKWKIITHLALNLSAFFTENGSAEPLKELLSIYDINQLTHNQNLINVLEKINAVTKINRMKIGGHYGFCNGIEINVYLNDSYKKYPGLYLFGCVLRTFFSMYAAINHFVRFKMLDKVGEVIYQWEPLIGSQHVL